MMFVVTGSNMLLFIFVEQTCLCCRTEYFFKILKATRWYAHNYMSSSIITNKKKVSPTRIGFQWEKPVRAVVLKKNHLRGADYTLFLVRHKVKPVYWTFNVFEFCHCQHVMYFHVFIAISRNRLRTLFCNIYVYLSATLSEISQM